MGNGTSVPSNVNRQNELIQEIHAIAQDLGETYKSKYLDPKFCTTVALIYNDKLMNYRKQDLNNVGMTLGIVADIPGQKSQLCESIIKHYMDRLNLIDAIRQSLNYCSNRIFALTTGPRCEGNPEIFDQAVCTKEGGRWVGYIVPPDIKLPENKQWYNYLNHAQSIYLETLSRMLDILKQLRDFDQDINNERLKVIGLEVEQLIDGMEKNCYQIYKLMLTTPTYTNEELRLQQEDKQTSQQEASARVAALRASRNLSPVQSK
jgi:hypothetical protein